MLARRHQDGDASDEGEGEGEEGAASEYDQPRGKQAGDPEIKREEGGETKERMGRKEEKKGLHSAKNHAAAEEGKRSVGWVGGSTNTHTRERIPGRSRRRFSFPPPLPPLSSQDISEPLSPSSAASPLFLLHFFTSAGKRGRRK